MDECNGPFKVWHIANLDIRREPIVYERTYLKIAYAKVVHDALNDYDLYLDHRNAYTGGDTILSNATGIRCRHDSEWIEMDDSEGEWKCQA
jgi:hypothetical protein